MNKKGIIIIAIVLIIGLYILNKISVARQLEFTVGVPKNISLKGGSLTFQLPLKAINISSGSVRIKSADFDVKSAGKYLGKAVIKSPITITPTGNTELLVDVNISYYDLLTASTGIINLFKSGKVNLSLDGLVYAEGFQVPIVQTFDFELPKF